MKIGLHDAEKEHIKNKIFPNLALMKISSYHKNIGDEVDWWTPLLQYDKVYSSKIFDFTPTNEYLPEDAIRGGTGYRDIPLNAVLPCEIDSCFPDYSIYPECDFAIGYLTRGCPRKCRWCVVPKKEGQIRPYSEWQDIVRSDTDKLTLMDNNILACDYGIHQLDELGQSDYKIDLNQGMDARLVTPEIAAVLSKVKWQKYIRFSCDQKSQIEHIKKVVELFKQRNIKPYRIFIYLLVTTDLEDASYRVEQLLKLGVVIYAQAEQNKTLGIIPNKLQKEFAQRYVYGRSYKKETWFEYCERLGLIL